MKTSILAASPHEKRKAQQNAAYQHRKAAARARNKQWAIDHLICMATSEATLRDLVERIDKLLRLNGGQPSALHREIDDEMAVRRSWLATQGGNTFAFVIPADAPDLERFRDVLMDAEWEQVSDSFEGPDGPDRMDAYRFTDEWAVLIRLSFTRYIEPV